MGIKEKLLLGSLILFIEIAFSYLVYITVPLIKGNDIYLHIACGYSFMLGWNTIAGVILIFTKNKINEQK